jgi:glycosyltransferase involved in cell wall biosynthesis
MFLLKKVIGKQEFNDEEITIITPVKNAVQYITENIIEVNNQKKCICKHIIIDGGSNDGTLEKLQLHCKKYNILLLIGEDNSNIDATNFALDYVKTKYFQILTVGDKYSNNLYIRNSIDRMLEKNLILSWSNSLLDKNYINNSKHISLIKYGVTLVDTRTVIADTLLIKKIGKFNSKYKLASDFDWICRIYLYGYKMEHSGLNLHIETNNNGITGVNYINSVNEIKEIIYNYWGFSIIAWLYRLRVILGYKLKLIYVRFKKI